MRGLGTGAALLALVASCALPPGEAMLRYGSLEIDGSFGVRSSTGKGKIERSDVKTAGFGDDDGVIGLRGELDYGTPRLSASFQVSRHDGAGTLTGNLDDGKGNAIPKGSQVSSDLDLGLYEVALTFDLVPARSIDAGLGLGVAGIAFDATITDLEPGGHTIRESRFVPLPVLAAHAGVILGDFRLTGTATGTKLRPGGDSLDFLDLDLFARYRILGGGARPAGFVGLGYRILAFDVQYDNSERIEIDLGFEGPYAAVSLGF